MKKGILLLILISLLGLISCDNKNKVEDILFQSEITNVDNENIIYNNYYELDNKLFTFINHILKKDYLLNNHASGMNRDLYKNGHYYENEYKIGEYYDMGFKDGIISFSIIDLDYDNKNEVIIYKFKQKQELEEEPKKRINYIEVYKDNNDIYEKICDKELISLCDISLYDIKYGYINDNNKSYISIDLNKKNCDTNENICDEHILYEFNNNNFVESNDNVDREKIVLLNNMYNEINNDIQKKHTVYSEHNNTYNNKYNINFVKKRCTL